MSSTSPVSTDRGRRDDGRVVKTMVVLGSGGHTTEMIRLLRELDPRRYAVACYVVADSDVTSIPRLREHIKREDEEEEEDDRRRREDDRRRREDGGKGRRRWEGRHPRETGGDSGEDNAAGDARRRRSNAAASAEVHRLPRAREVHQSYLTSILTTLHALFRTMLLVWRVRPELVLANGPGTCVPVIYSAFLLRWLTCGRRRCRIVFVESVCRVTTLSLSGRLARPVVDKFVVHWPRLRERCPEAELCDVFVRHDDEGARGGGGGGVAGCRAGESSRRDRLSRLE